MSQDNELTRRQIAKLMGTGVTVGLAGCIGGGDGTGDSGNGTNGDGSGTGDSGNDTNSSAQTQGNSSAPNVDEISLLTWNIQFLEDSIKGWIDDFKNPDSPVEADYSNINVTWVDRGQGDVATYYQTQLQSGNPINVVDTQGSVYTRFASEGAFAPLGEMVSNEFLGKIGDKALEFSRLDGTLYRIPFYQNCSSTYRRNKWFDEAGLEPPKTTKEFFDTSRALVEDSGAEHGMTFVTFNYRLWPFFWAEGINVLNEDQTEAAFNTSRAVEIVERFQKQTSEGIIPSVTWTGRVEEQSNQFGTGNTGMFITPLASIRRVQSAGDWVSPDTFSLSVPPGNSGTYQAHGLSITAADSSDAEQQASWDLIRTIMSEKWQEDFLRNTTVIAGNTAVQNQLADNEEFRNNNPLKVMAYDLWPKLTEGYVTPPSIPESSEISSTLDSQISSAALGEKEPQTALDDAEQQINSLLSG